MEYDIKNLNRKTSPEDLAEIRGNDIISTDGHVIIHWWGSERRELDKKIKVKRQIQER